ncbi:fimbrillin family protein [Prevotella sp. E9-3]|uniref:fimbrillin family protein n=1 Tax=Prevotella sp. E9-3 TaxID=2913621 RepID=UPI001EDB5D23|nr:fimbrillin family protein [Prevotella sp. E9-3]UKK48731.1 fimbrillin family protein [Prevotella sp. E9-3]
MIIKQIYKCVALLLAVVFTGCSADDETAGSLLDTAVELQGIQATIDDGTSGNITRGTVTKLEEYIGRSAFKGGDKAVYTDIRRTFNPLPSFTYPGLGGYEGIIFVAGNGGGWTRQAGENEPERVYWSDAVSPHTFIAYSTPNVADFDWTPFTPIEGEKVYYAGTLGNPSDNGAIVYSSSEDLENEDLLLSYSTQVTAEPGGSVAQVKFTHALSNVRVVVDIDGFSAGSNAVDNRSVVSNMRLLHQPTKYVWKQASAGVQPVNYGEDNPRKDLLLWTPNAEGSGTAQYKKFTFYGITIPQTAEYISTIPESDVEGRTVQLRFDVTYPNPLNPKENVTKTYTASLTGVYFEAGYNTTINISLNHRNEEMTVGADYENWLFVATPEVGELKKNSTFLHDTERKNVTILGDANATMDDATWLYRLNNVVYDIYGHNGETPNTAYQISTAYQLLSFAYEVKNGHDFAGKYVRLDADITLQPEHDSQVLSWIGIGDATHPFNGTFLGGERFIYRLKGTPLFVSLGANAKIEQLQVNAVVPENSAAAVSGSGLFANSNAGLICGSKVVGDVTFNSTVAGAFVGENTGVIFASYHIGTTKSTAASASVGGLVGSNSGTIVGCYQAGKVVGTTTGGIAAVNTGVMECSYANVSDMTKASFVETINAGIAAWRASHPEYDDHSYVYQPANYPKLAD